MTLAPGTVIPFADGTDAVVGCPSEFRKDDRLHKVNSALVGTGWRIMLVSGDGVMPGLIAIEVPEPLER